MKADKCYMCDELQQMLTDTENKIETITNNAVNLIGGNVCDAHSSEISNMTFGEFQQLEKTTKCKYCQQAALEELGKQIDRIDALCHMMKVPLSDSLRVEGLRDILPDICAEMKRYCSEALGENPWEDGGDV